MQALQVSGMIRPGRRGLGFGVGVEPITPYLAARGCSILATDLPSSADASVAWNDTGQQRRASPISTATACAPPTTSPLASSSEPSTSTRSPTTSTGFDFAWSSCAMEHLGSLQAGADFLERQLRCVKPGGLTVHTTEFNVSSNDETLVDGHTVLYRRRDLEDLAMHMRAAVTRCASRSRPVPRPKISTSTACRTRISTSACTPKASCTRRSVSSFGAGTAPRNAPPPVTPSLFRPSAARNVAIFGFFLLVAVVFTMPVDPTRYRTSSPATAATRC